MKKENPKEVNWHKKPLWGDVETTTLENRIFNILMFMVFLVGLVQTALNIIVGQILILTIFSAIAMFGGYLLYLYSLRTGNYKPFVAPIFIVSLLLITAACFLDNGIEGSTPILYFIPFVSAQVFLKDRERTAFIYLTFGLITLVLIAECCFPHLIHESSTSGKSLTFDFAITIFLAMCVILAILRTVFDQQEKDRERLSKAYDEIAALQEFLPICSRCKKIRDDKGYWNKLEAYMKAHKKIEFTHGLCPECLEITLKENTSG